MTGATRFGLFRRLRRATSRVPPAPGLTTTAPDLDRGPAYPFPPLALPGVAWRPEPQLQGLVLAEEIVEPVWVLELDG